LYVCPEIGNGKSEKTLKILKKLYRVLIFSNVLIALAAVAQCALAYRVLRLPFGIPVLAIVGCATLLLYNAVLLLSWPKDPAKSPYLRTRWVFGHPSVPIAGTLLALSGLLCALSCVGAETLFFLALLGVFGLLYGLPVFTFRGRKAGLRQLPGLKLFHIAAVWSLSTVGLPVLDAGASGAAGYEAGYLGSLTFLFMLACTLPFDIRDLRPDALYGLKTLPVLLGEGRARLLCHVLLAAHALLVLLSPFSFAVIGGLLATDLAVALTLRMVLFRHSGRYHDVYLLDAALIVQLAMVLLADWACSG